MARMLCSGTGGPSSGRTMVLTCPVCGHTWGDLHGPLVPRHFIGGE